MSDYHKRYNFLGELFPNQFRSIPSIIVWTLVFIVDVVIIFAVAHLLGFDVIGTALRQNGSYSGLYIYLGLAFVLFCLESFVYNRIKQ